MKADILIKHATIVDGTGDDRFQGSIAVRDGKIARIIRQSDGHEGDAGSAEEAREVIDAQGMIVSPGFIDTHVHSDLMLLWDRQHASGLQQGITTELLGQDGLSYAPLGKDNLAMYFQFLAGLNGAPDIPLDWSTVREYRMKFDRTVAINTAYQVPHGALRLETLGMRDLPLTGKSLEQAKRLLDQGLKEGAVAFSTGLSYYPCSYSDTEEMVELCKVVADNSSVYVTHIRTVFREEPIDPVLESIEIAERSGAKLHFSHYRTSLPKAGRVKEVMEHIDAAYERGVDLTLELYPYPSGSGYVVIWLPLWCFEGGFDALLERLADPKQRPRLIEGIEKNTIPVGGYFTNLPNHPQYIGRSFREVAQERGQSIPDMLCDLLLAEKLQVGYHDSAESMFDEASLEAWDRFNRDCLELLSRPYYMVGSDGIPLGQNPHPRAFGTFPRLLRFCREYGFRLETMINRMTKVPADRFGLKNRGVLKEDCAADIVIFNEQTVTDTATYQLSRSAPVGIPYVVVNGKVAVRGEKVTGVFAGRALEREG
ncbi:amidohydrolase family protein [Paenibacillus sp. J2TS4]|uniref:N-acyl-D-amino-acid deacylase family protein n=1 Tax=Paenibacillus sp. J2TS4 TaxID=2807194 RepID=UPI001B188AE6|nr:D-aminoacylase [Paenibacillus sp. J2TS4]GIP34996.1 N-acyl-D-amino-acid deacylase [Paenibacillus sp. J2TS4]